MTIASSVVMEKVRRFIVSKAIVSCCTGAGVVVGVVVGLVEVEKVEI